MPDHRTIRWGRLLGGGLDGTPAPAPGAERISLPGPAPYFGNAVTPHPEVVSFARHDYTLRRIPFAVGEHRLDVAVYADPRLDDAGVAIRLLRIALTDDDTRTDRVLEVARRIRRLAARTGLVDRNVVAGIADELYNIVNR